MKRLSIAESFYSIRCLIVLSLSIIFHTLGANELKAWVGSSTRNNISDY